MNDRRLANDLNQFYCRFEDKEFNPDTILHDTSQQLQEQDFKYFGQDMVMGSLVNDLKDLELNGITLSDGKKRPDSSHTTGELPVRTVGWRPSSGDLH
ncbi:hypothetical protein JOQ06_011790, partial [Pogonophryne albipinna]